jgi:hypothetical protein
VNVFIVDPGSYASVIARLRAPASPAALWVVRVVGRHRTPSPSSSPVRGSIIIAIAALAWCAAAPAASARSVMNVR